MLVFSCAFLNGPTSGKTENIHLHPREALFSWQQQHFPPQLAHCPFDVTCLLFGDQVRLGVCVYTHTDTT